MPIQQTIRNAADVRRCIDKLCEIQASADKPLVMTIAPPKSRRSLAQNKYYHGPLLTTIAEQAVVNGKSYSKVVWHNYFKREMGIVDIVEMPDGSEDYLPKSTAKYTVTEMAEYMTKIEAYAVTELNVILPGNPDARVIYGNFRKAA